MISLTVDQTVFMISQLQWVIQSENYLIRDIE
jgi:hypothetical protein